MAERTRHFAIDFRPERAPWSLALLAGAALSFAFAPFNQWWLAVVAPAVLMLLWGHAPDARTGARLGFWFGLGLYAAGTWWLYISIRIFGEAPIVVALGVMAGLVLIMAAYQALLGYVVCRWLAPASLAGRLLWVPAAWVLLEWWRGWFLTGFPWMSLGYSQTDTWLAGLAPVGGVPETTGGRFAVRVTVIENAGSAALSRPSLTRITMPDVVPACLVPGVPLSRPVLELK